MAGGKEMTPFEHKERHVFLHKCLDELVADYIAKTGKRLSNSTIMELVQWSHDQTIKPATENAPIRTSHDDGPPNAS